MKIKERTYHDITILDVSGSITIGKGDVEFRNYIDTALARGHRNFLINMNKVRRVDSSGIGEVIATRSRILEQGGELKLLNLSPKVSDVLYMTQVLTVLEVFDDEITALASFARLAAVG